jgi:hypothetical protein
MDMLILIIKNVTDMIKSFINAVTPTAIYIYSIVAPLIKSFVLWLISIDFYSIFTSYIFIGFLLLVISYISIYLYLRIYKPELYKKIKDALTFRNEQRLKRHKFVFETDLDFKISS